MKPLKPHQGWSSVSSSFFTDERENRALIFFQNTLCLRDCLRIQFALHVHMCQRTARHADLRRLHAVTTAVQSLQFALNSRIRRLRFKRPASAKRNDYNLPPGVDPYRTTYGMTEFGLAMTILGIMGGVGGLIALLIWLLT